MALLVKMELLAHLGKAVQRVQVVLLVQVEKADHQDLAARLVLQEQVALAVQLVQVERVVLVDHQEGQVHLAKVVQVEKRDLQELQALAGQLVQMDQVVLLVQPDLQVLQMVQVVEMVLKVHQDLLVQAVLRDLLAR